MYVRENWLGCRTVVHKLQRCRRHLTILRARTTTLRRLPTVGSQILGTTVPSVVAMATRCQGFVKPCCRTLETVSTGCFFVKFRVSPLYGEVGRTITTETRNAYRILFQNSAQNRLFRKQV